MKAACWNLTTSIVTMSLRGRRGSARHESESKGKTDEMGMRLLSVRIKVRTSLTNLPAPDWLLSSSRRRYHMSSPKTCVRTVDPMAHASESTRRMPRRNRICTLTMRSMAVRLIGAALQGTGPGQQGRQGRAPDLKGETDVALRMSLVSWPVKTTSPYSHPVLRSCAPRSSIWSGPSGVSREVAACPACPIERVASKV